MGHHIIKIFMSSPSDVRAERDTVSHLVDEINDVLEYLGPRETLLKLQFLRYETDTYPDYGQPQEVVNRQMPDDYHVFIGVMWARGGTPTGKAESGTIEEFERARARRQRSILPKMMFYFCDQPVPIPDLEGVAQLEKVVRFRQALASQGLTASYRTHEEFREVVRGGLLRAVQDIFNNDECLREIGEQSTLAAMNEADRATMLELAAEYDRIRREMPAGAERTGRMTGVLTKMTGRAASVRPMLLELQQSARAGERLAAVAILKMFPKPDQLIWLAERLDPDVERPFVGYQAAVALLDAVQSLPAAECAAMRDAVGAAMKLAQRNQNDKPRLAVLASAQNEIKRKCGADGSA